MKPHLGPDDQGHLHVVWARRCIYCLRGAVRLMGTPRTTRNPDPEGPPVYAHITCARRMAQGALEPSKRKEI